MIFEGRTAVVTGGAGGIGRALSEVLATNGVRVAIIDIDGAAVARAAADLSALGHSVDGYACDLASDIAVEDAGARITDQFGTPDIVFNNAALTMLGSVDAIVIDDWRQALDVNVLGYVRMMKAFAPGMIARGSGHFVNVASSMGIVPDPVGAAFLMPYVTSKAAEVGLSQAMAIAFQRHGIGVSLFIPAITDTWTGARPGIAPEAAVAKLGAVTQAGATPRETAETLIAGLREDRFLITGKSDLQDKLHALVAKGLDPRAAL